MRKKFFLVCIVVLIISIVGMATQVALAAEKKNGVIHWKAHSAWIRGPGLQEAADYFTKTLNNLCEGQLVIDRMYAAGELLGAFELIPACSKGKLDLVDSSGYYLTGTLPWISLIIGTAANYMDYAAPYLSWYWEGGGHELEEEYVGTKYNVKVWAAHIIPAEAIYSVKPIKKKEDFGGLKIRTSGLSMDFFRSLGAAPVTLPLSEVMPALERKVLDAAEFSVPWTDYPVRIHEIAPYALTGILHSPPCMGREVYINRDSWKALPDDLKRKVEYAIRLTKFWYIDHLGLRNAVLWKKMLNEGLKVTKASPELQAWMKEKGDELAEKYAAKDPWAKKILDSQKAYLKTWNSYYDNVRWFK